MDLGDCDQIVSAGQSIQTAVDDADDGALICVEAGVYSESVHIAGRQGLTLRAIPADRASVVIDGTGVPINDNSSDQYFSGLVTIEDSSKIRVDGFQVRHSAAFGIVIYASDDVVVSNNHSYDTTNSGISAWGDRNANPVRFSTAIEISDNEVELANNGGQQENISLQDVDGFVVRNNYVHGTGAGQSGIGGEGIDAKNGARNGFIFENTVTRSRANGKPCLYVDGYRAGKHTYNIAVFRNVVTDCGGPGIMIASEEGGEVENILIHDNIVADNLDNQYGIKVSSYDDGGDPDRHILHNIAIFNNTIVGNNGGIMISEKDPAVAGLPVNFQSILIANNLLESNSPYTQLQFESILLDPETFKLDYVGQFQTENNAFFPDNDGSSSGAYIRHDGNDPLFTAASSVSWLDALVPPPSQRQPAYVIVGGDILDAGEPVANIIDHFDAYQRAHDDLPDGGMDEVDFPVPSADYEGFLAQALQHLSVDFAGRPRVSGAGIDVGAIEQQIGPSADFDAVPTVVLVDGIVTFSGTSSDQLLDWFWDFDADGIADAAGPTVEHSYDAVGTYSVALTVSNADGATQILRPGLIRVVAPVADFAMEPAQGTAPLTVGFSNSSVLANPTPDWHWDFGDGASSTAKDPTHTFESAGDYVVTLTVDGQLTRQRTVSVEAPVAAFAIDPVAPTVGSPVQFEDRSTLTNIASWDWDFGDGSASTAQHPGHTYSSAGDYTVTLTVADADGTAKSASRNVQVVDQIDDVVFDNLDEVFSTADGFGSYDPSSTDADEYAGSAVLSWTRDSTATWRLPAPVAGRYDLYVYFPDAGAARLGTAAYTVAHLGGVETTTLVQEGQGNAWRLIAEGIELDATGSGSIELKNLDGNVIADAVKLVYRGDGGGKADGDGGDAPVVIFADDFESGLTWITAGDASLNTDEPNHDGTALRVLKVGAAEQVVSTAGYGNLSLGFAMGAKSLDNAAEEVLLEWWDGVQWLTAARISNGSTNENGQLNPYSVELPETAADNPDFALRFRIAGSGRRDFGYLDDLSVWGTPR